MIRITRAPKNRRKLKITDNTTFGQKRYQNVESAEQMLDFSSQRCKSDGAFRARDVPEYHLRLMARRVEAA